MFDFQRTAIAAVVALGLAGCASFSADGGLGPVQQAAQQRLGPQVSVIPDGQAARQVRHLLDAPLDAEAAVQIALLDNPGLQAALAEVGISEADRVQAGRLPNPGFSFGRLARGSEIEIDRGLHFDLMRLLTVPLAGPIEDRRFARAQHAATIRVLQLASDTRQAYVIAVAAGQSLRYLEQVQQSADASAELARRMAEAGNWNKLNEAREQSFRSEAALNLASARRSATSARERLTRLLGGTAAQSGFTLPERLPELPASPRGEPDVEQAAMTSRLDVQAATLAAEQTAKNLGLTRTTRFVNVLEIGAARNSYNDGATERGYDITLELPLFDWGTAREKKAEATYRQSLAQAARIALDARSEVRERYQAYRSRYEVARRYRDEIVPLKKRISDENLLRYNGMLISVFELLADARSQIAGVNAALEAQRDFWLADAGLDMALIAPSDPTRLP